MKMPSKVWSKLKHNGPRSQCLKEAKSSDKSEWLSEKRKKPLDYLFPWKWVKSSLKEPVKFKKLSTSAIWHVASQDQLGTFKIYFSGSIFNSERPEHFMMEIWNPLGIVGIITAFNFPNAVFGWNAAIALICGNCITWKGSPQTSMVTIASSMVIADVLAKNGINPNVMTVLQGGVDIGSRMVEDKRIPLISFTGSTHVGKIIRQKVNERFGNCLLELGGNNATIIMGDANLEMAFKACTFAAVGTCGQRCTSLRRLIIHEKIYDSFVEKLVKAYSSIKIGDPLEEGILCGPLNSSMGLNIYEKCVESVVKHGGKLLCGGKRIERKGYFVEPTIIAADKNAEYLQEEYFCPIMFVIKFSTL